MKIICSWRLQTSIGEKVAEMEDLSLVRIHSDPSVKALDTLNLSAKDSILHAENFLIQQVAYLFSMPVADVETSKCLQTLGLDSLMALSLSRSIEIGLDKSFPLDKLISGMSIDGILNYLFNLEKTQSHNDNSWIVHRVRQANPKLRLFCFPFAGGGASIFKKWQNYFSTEIEVCPVQLPGKEERLNEKSILNIDVLVTSLIDSLHEEMDVPFAFYGHSFGSLVAFELARQLRKRNMQQPIHLFVSAFPAPSTPTESLDNLIIKLNEQGLVLDENMCDEDLKKMLMVLDENGLIISRNSNIDFGAHRLLIKTFIADLKIVKSFQYSLDKPFEFPISVFVGKNDNWVKPEDQKSWQDYSREACEFYEFDSGHMFILEEAFRIRVCEIIDKQLMSESFVA